MRKTIITMAVSLCAAWSGAHAQTSEDARYEAFNRSANGTGDCSGYETMADAALAGRPGGSLVHRVSAAAAICAARDGRLDLTERLIARFPTSAPGFRDYLVAAPYTFMIRRLVEIPGAGRSALAAARRLPDIDPMFLPNNQRSELMAMAAFAAGEDTIGLQILDEVGRTTALSIQVDRRFLPAWRDSAALRAYLGGPATPPKIVTGDLWLRRLIALDQTSDETTVLTAARQAMRDDIADSVPSFGLAEGHLGTYGGRQRAWIVARRLEAGQLDAASEALDLDRPGRYDARDPQVLDGVIRLASALILADRANGARQLLNRWERLDDKGPAPEGVPVEYGIPKDADPNIAPIKALRAHLGSTPPVELKPDDWWLALACAYPEDQTAALLLAALKEPFYRSQALQVLNLPPRYPPMGKADENYRQHRDALLARADVAAAIERYGRRLPPDLAWRLSRANLPF